MSARRLQSVIFCEVVGRRQAVQSGTDNHYIVFSLRLGAAPDTYATAQHAIKPQTPTLMTTGT